VRAAAADPVVAIPFGLPSRERAGGERRGAADVGSWAAAHVRWGETSSEYGRCLGPAATAYRSGRFSLTRVPRAHVRRGAAVQCPRPPLAQWRRESNRSLYERGIWGLFGWWGKWGKWGKFTPNLPLRCQTCGANVVGQMFCPPNSIYP
jgi:hypothetical protein